MKLTILGSGTSQGVPVIGCRCAVCTSSDKRDHRLRTSVMVETDGGVRIIIDAGPDFRYQMLRAGVCHIDGILLTHGHKDHIGGIDDVRAFNFVDYPPVIHDVDIYASATTARIVRKDYDYAFEEVKYRGAPCIHLHEIDVTQPFYVGNECIIPIDGYHAAQMPVTGYRIGKVAYLTDFKRIADAEVAKLVGVELMVVDALRYAPHHSHFSVSEALALIERVHPQRALLTHMSHEIGLYAEANARLPEGVEFAYDGLSVTL